MATEYLCDLSDGTFVDRTGVDVANELTGPAGMQAAIRGTGLATALVAGDILYCAGTGDLSRLIEIDCNGTDISGWGIGDTVQNDNLAGGAEGDDWTGVVVEPNVGAVSDIVLIWLDSGFDEADVNTADGIVNTVAGGGAGDPTNVGAFTSVDTPGIEIDNNEGSSASGHIKIIGTTDLSSPGSNLGQAILDGSDGAVNRANSCVRMTASLDYIWFQTLTLQNSSDDGLVITQAGSDFHVFWDVYSINNTGHGFEFGGSGARHAIFILCRANNNGQAGFNRFDTNVRLVFCEAIDNTNAGFDTLDAITPTMYGCIVHGNGTGVDVFSSSANIFNCVIDGNDTDGVLIAGGDSHLLVGNRITNNGTGAGHYGIDDTASGVSLENWNFFFGNTSNQDRNNIDAGPDSDSTHADSDDGYVNAGADDWNVKSGASLRSTAIELD